MNYTPEELNETITSLTNTRDCNKIVASFIKVTSKEFPFFTTETSKEESEKLVADFFGMTVSEFSNSPNHDQLQFDYIGGMFPTYVKRLMEECELTEIEVYSIFYFIETHKGDKN